MCGITGYWLLNHQFSEAEMSRIIKNMTDSLIHRGPDDSGVWMDPKLGLALGHRRLSIIDLSPAGRQPMRTSDGKYVIAFNGEIYNHNLLRNKLSELGYTVNWNGNSDTETLLLCLENWGIEKTLQSCVGMFAISIWDIQTQTLTLARDRLGEKPIYYGWNNEAFIFGSELKALRAYVGFKQNICRKALSQYFRFSYVPAPLSIYQGIFKLEPGCLLSISGAPPKVTPLEPIRPGGTHGRLNIKRWWSLKQKVELGIDYFETEDNLIQNIEKQLVESVNYQSSADVSLGAFLSGGVDSSTIVAIMQQQTKKRIKTFTIGFEERNFNEALYSRSISKHLGTDHFEMFVTSKNALDLIPNLPVIYDEPFADSSQIPTFLVSQMAKAEVTVALSGDGGDELFGGYNRYIWAPKIWNKFGSIPYSFRQVLLKGVKLVPKNIINRIENYPLMQGIGINNLSDKLQKTTQALDGVKNLNTMYLKLISNRSDPANIVLGIEYASQENSKIILNDSLPESGVEEDSLSMMYMDAMTYLPDDILSKVDRASMACGLETRVPFLDHRVVEMAWRLPLNMKIRGNTGKWILRKILYKYVPKELIERPKTGFAVPIGNWLRGPLRPWAEDLINEKRLISEGYLNPKHIYTIWHEHLLGIRDNSSELWTVLMFQSWLEKYG